MFTTQSDSAEIAIAAGECVFYVFNKTFRKLCIEMVAFIFDGEGMFLLLKQNRNSEGFT